MSLKSFHLVFITAASALAFGCGVWEVGVIRSGDGGTFDLAFAVGWFATGVGLLVYERFFLKKLKNVSYL